MNKEVLALTQKAEKYADTLQRVEAEVKRVIVGQDHAIEKLLIALITGGHVLIEGVPGLAKTLLIKTLATCLHCSFVRIQFTPDLLPADITGTKIYNHKKSSFSTVKGPVFHHFVLADEINRAPPKVQSALLEAMQEHQVSIQGQTYPLPAPFFVLATQNPIESEGTYKLPEAQVDRFMFKLLMHYPTKTEEKDIIERFTRGYKITTKRSMTVKQILDIQRFNPQIYADEKIEHYVAEIVDATRFPKNYQYKFCDTIDFGASPRASLWLILAGKAHALLNGRGYVTPEDIQAVAHEVLRHRIILNYEAESEGVTSDAIITAILAHIRVP